jgi:hypothetical protein
LSAIAYGGDISEGILIGALYGTASGAVTGGLAFAGVPNLAPFGSSEIGTIGNRLVNSAIVGGVAGAGYAAMHGDNILEGAALGAEYWTVGEAANMLIGHAYGFIASGGKGPKFVDGAFVYYTNSDSAITFGNVVTGGKSFLYETVRINGQPDPLGRTNLQHEISHIYQDGLLEPAYIPTHASLLTVGGIIGILSGRGFIIGTHRYNVFERWWIDVPSYY